MWSKLSLFIFAVFIFAEKAYAQPVVGLDSRRPNRGVSVNMANPVQTFGTVIQNTILLLFTVGALGFTIMFLWGAVSWILSGGDKEKVAGARKRMTTAIVGLVLLSLTFVIMQVLGHVLGIGSLVNRNFQVPRLLQ